MILKQWKVWCETEGDWVYGWFEEEPVVCPHNKDDHTIDPSKTAPISVLTSETPLPSRGSGVRFRSKALTHMDEPFSVIAQPGKKLLMLTSKVMFNDNLENIPAIVFELRKKIQLGQSGDPQYYTVSQNYYANIAELVVDCDRTFFEAGFFRLDFDWPTFIDPERDPTILEGITEDELRVYLTRIGIHVGEGSASTNLYEYIGPVKVYHPYEVTQDRPVWRVTAIPKVKAAHFCFHCISYDEDEV